MNPESAAGIWIVDGDKVRVELNVPDSAVASVRQGAVTKGAILPARKLFEGNRGIGYNPFLQGGALFSEEYPPTHSLQNTPFGYADMTGSNGGLAVDRIIEKCVNGDGFECSLSEPQALDGLGVVVLTCVERGPQGQAELRYYLDPERGFIPVRNELRVAGTTVMTCVVTEVRQCSRGRWFPTRIVTVQHRKDPFVRVKDLRVTKLDVDSAPPASAFQIAVDAKSAFHHGVDANSQFVIMEARTISLGDLDGLLGKARAIRAYRDKLPTQADIVGDWRRWAIASLTLVVLSAVAIYLYRRHKISTT